MLSFKIHFSIILLPTLNYDLYELTRSTLCNVRAILYLSLRHPTLVQMFWCAFRPALGPTQPSIQWVPEALTRYTAAGEWSWSLISI